MSITRQKRLELRICCFGALGISHYVFSFPAVGEYMSLPASQYSVLDAERIERVDDNTFRCYVYRFKFFAFEVCPVLLVRVEEQPNGCIIRLLSCKVYTPFTGLFFSICVRAVYEEI